MLNIYGEAPATWYCAAEQDLYFDWSEGIEMRSVAGDRDSFCRGLGQPRIGLVLDRFVI